MVMALHGGTGHGGAFRGRGCATRVASAPSSSRRPPSARLGADGEDVDTPNLARILGEVRVNWPLDPARLLLKG